MNMLHKLNQKVGQWLGSGSHTALSEPERYTRMLLKLGARIEGRREEIVYFEFRWEGLAYKASITHQADGQACIEVLGKVVVYQEVLEAMNNFLDLVHANGRDKYQYRLLKYGEGYSHFAISTLPHESVSEATFARVLPEMAVNVEAINAHAMELYRMVLKADADARKESS